MNVIFRGLPIRDHRHLELQGETYVAFVDTARRYLDCSDGVCELLGYSRTEILNKNVDDLSYNTTEVATLFEKYVRHGLQEGDYILRHKTGAPIYVKYHAWVFADGCFAAAWKPAEEWEQLYFAALLEFRPDRLRNKINIALTAIQKRQLNLVADTPEIRQKIRDALSALHTLSS